MCFHWQAEIWKEITLAVEQNKGKGKNFLKMTCVIKRFGEHAGQGKNTLKHQFLYISHILPGTVAELVNFQLINVNQSNIDPSKYQN